MILAILDRTLPAIFVCIPLALAGFALALACVALFTPATY